MRVIAFWTWMIGAGITFMLTARTSDGYVVFGSGEYTDAITYALFWPLFAIKYLFMGIGFLAINLIDLMF